MGIEPTFEAWEAPVLPLNYTRLLTSETTARNRAGQNLTLVWLSPKTLNYTKAYLEGIMGTEIAEVLIDIEAQLRQLGLWDKIPPSSQAIVPIP